MSIDPVVSAAADDYVGQPPNFGADTHLIRITARDAFGAGVEWLLAHPNEYERLRAVWALEGS